MNAMAFGFWFAVVLFALTLIAIRVGYTLDIKSLDKPTWYGIVIDNRERVSLSRLQLVQWTLLVLTSMLVILIGDLYTGREISALNLPLELLGLLGISVGSLVTSGTVKNGKDTDPKYAANIARGGERHPSAQAIEEEGTGTNKDMVTPHWRQIFLEEEGARADRVVSVSKFQNFIFTLVLGAAYVAMTIAGQTYPELSQQMLWLLGISHAGYVGAKIPNKR